ARPRPAPASQRALTPPRLPPHTPTTPPPAPRPAGPPPPITKPRRTVGRRSTRASTRPRIASFSGRDISRRPASRREGSIIASPYGRAPAVVDLFSTRRRAAAPSANPAGSAPLACARDG